MFYKWHTQKGSAGHVYSKVNQLTSKRRTPISPPARKTAKASPKSLSQMLSCSAWRGWSCSLVVLPLPEPINSLASPTSEADCFSAPLTSAVRCFSCPSSHNPFGPRRGAGSRGGGRGERPQTAARDANPLPGASSLNATSPPGSKPGFLSFFLSPRAKRRGQQAICEEDSTPPPSLG